MFTLNSDYLFLLLFYYGEKFKWFPLIKPSHKADSAPETLLYLCLVLLESGEIKLVVMKKSLSGTCVVHGSSFSQQAAVVRGLSCCLLYMAEAAGVIHRIKNLKSESEELYL
ncbi:hypothetical protein GOODEAATRI_023991 [Goodea atripinnis]|uniref:Uncharacterized protein n=1 Tax=Goodea atripinnis TaxID=208336 RepID=A0ABV0Q0K6_9TELE